MRALVSGDTNDALKDVTKIRITALFADLGDLDEIYNCWVSATGIRHFVNRNY